MTKETGEGREREWERGREGERGIGIERASERGRERTFTEKSWLAKIWPAYRASLLRRRQWQGQQRKQWRTEAGAAAQAYEQAHRRAGTECWDAGTGRNVGRATSAYGLGLERGQGKRRRGQAWIRESCRADANSNGIRVNAEG